MARHVDYQVARARAAASRAGAGVHVLVASEAEGVLSAMRRLWTDRRLVFSHSLPADLVVLANAEDLGEILGNLIDNAAKWALHEVRLSGGVRDGMAILEVEDDGPGVPAEYRRSVMGLGVRLDERKPGSGLGLAIVSDLVGLYGGSITLGDSDLGGLKVSIALPIPN